MVNGAAIVAPMANGIEQQRIVEFVAHVRTAGSYGGAAAADTADSDVAGRSSRYASACSAA